MRFLLLFALLTLHLRAQKPGPLLVVLDDLPQPSTAPTLDAEIDPDISHCTDDSSGIAIFGLEVEKDGSAKHIKPVRKNPSTCVQTAVTEALQKAHFTPGTSNGKPVPVKIGIGIVPLLETASSATREPVITTPVLLKNFKPVMPDKAPRHSSGAVTVHLTIGPDGVPANVSAKTATADFWIPNAVDAVRQYRFYPATKDGKPAKVDIDVDISFQRF